MIGTVLKNYTDYLADLEGYNENKTLDSEKYEPASIAHKNFFLLFDEKEREPMSGNYEKATVYFTLNVIYEFPSKNSFSTNQNNTLDEMGSLERGLLNFAISDGKVIFMDRIGLSRITADFRLATFTGRLIYQRSLANG